MMKTAVPPIAETPLPDAADAVPMTRGYFQQTWPVNLILATFFLVTIPLAIITLTRPNALLMWTYIWLFGMTHFVVTIAIYCQSRNLSYFTSSVRNGLIYLAIPIAVFIGFDLLHAFRIGILYPTFALFFWGAVRLLDLNHFNRQTFGVYQLFKARAKLKTTATMKRCENGYFHSLTALMMTTFLSGGISPFLLTTNGEPLWVNAGGLAEPVLPIGVLKVLQAMAGLSAIGFLTASMRTFRNASRMAGHPDGLRPALLYLLFQSLGAIMAAVSFPLYLAALAMHYVEYHVLMVPRCLHVSLDESSKLDRTYGWFRDRPIAFYAIVLAVALLVTYLSFAGMGMMGRSPETLTKPFDYLLLIAVFDGLFVFHYFVEMFIWRFSDPYYRLSLAGLYFK